MTRQKTKALFNIAVTFVGVVTEGVNCLY